MEVPRTLNNYFTVVDDFFRKTFRDDSHLFMALKSRQYSESLLGENMFGQNAAALSAAAPAALLPVEASDRLSREEAPAAAPLSPKPPTRLCNFLSISPRMALNRTGAAEGKMKVAYEFDVPRVCRFQQALALNNRGTVTIVGTVKELVQGLTAGMRASVNTIMPASEDVTSGQVHYQRGDKYSSLGYQRNGLGSSNLLLDCGITFFNLLLGAGFERRQLSFLEQREGSGQLDVMYVGAGFTGINWSIAAKMVRSNNAWSNARMTVLQRLTPTTAVACQYNFDLVESVAKVSLGFTQGIQLRLPALIQTRGAGFTSAAAVGASKAPPTLTPGWCTPVPLVVAAKAESDGHVAATIRGLFHNSIRWGLVAQKNLLDDAAVMKYGITLSMEYDS